eukprot:TRINITY_DN22685_c0_g2_i2.p1 TRINITY_DN22685_c0_g2~~TRINITY_DN22685_c0_g2_i2.p1  ORF type:complete len:557 (+),score=84.53 TRINITY_DN22685_c0_g2_i2:65-1735(+)
MFRNALLLFLALCKIQLSSCGNSLRGQGSGRTHTDAERLALVELAGKFTRSDGSSRLAEMETALSSMYQALPKDQHGALPHEVVPYALHRLFVQRHSWNIRGLDQTVAQVAKAPDQSIEGDLDFKLDSVPVLPSLLQNKVEHQHAGVGLSLTELAAIAASIEDLVHREAMHRMGIAFDALDFSKDAALTVEDMNRAVNTWFTTYLWGYDFEDWSLATIKMENKTLYSSSRWLQVGPFVKELQKNASKRLFSAGKTSYSFEDTSHIVEAIGDKYGTLNEAECRGVKQALLTMEWKMPGRVRLSDFYNKSLIKTWWFGEKIDYLRTLGALDESNISNPLVIVTNYLTSPPQCFQASSLYNLCCRNECEDVMVKLEGLVGAPDETPENIARHIATIETDTVKQRESLSDGLMKRLQWIADDHGGRVPIHSRKFHLWLHHAFPRECPFPHKEGTTSPLTPDEWMKTTGQTTQMASPEEMSEHIRDDDSCTVAEELPWIEYSESIWEGAPSNDFMGTSENGTLMIGANVLFLLSIFAVATVVRFRQGYATKWELDLKAKFF